jgi:putative ABC transport system permease protein
MIRHTFKLIWNRKRRNFLLISEIFFSFVVLFAVGSMAISSIVKYLKPLGFSYENVWVLHTGWRELDEERVDVRATFMQIEQEMQSCPEIEQVSWTESNFPYGRAIFGTALELGGQEFSVDFYPVDDNYAEVLDIRVSEGRWFNREDDASSRTPIVLNRQLKERLFGSETAVGEIYTKKDREYMVVGVVDNYRYRGEFESYRGGFFQRAPLHDTTASLPSKVLFAVRRGTSVQFEEQLIKRLSSVAPGWNMRIETMAQTRKSYVKEHMVGMIIQATVAGFLVFNVALGLFGVLWYSINRRRGEIGLRRAVGANGGHISGQILGESLVLATFAIIAGLFIAIQVPIIGLWGFVGTGVYLVAMVCAAALIYFLVAVCALYPSHLAARIEPAMALHDE